MTALGFRLLLSLTSMLISLCWFASHGSFVRPCCSFGFCSLCDSILNCELWLWSLCFVLWLRSAVCGVFASLSCSWSRSRSVKSGTARRCWFLKMEVKLRHGWDSLAFGCSLQPSTDLSRKIYHENCLFFSVDFSGLKNVWSRGTDSGEHHEVLK